jgi:hypothetical protein
LADGMANNPLNILTPEKALIFRLYHRDNLDWTLRNGLYCRNSDRQDSNFRPIGNMDLIRMRKHWQVRHELGGVLGDYVPFYFTPRSIMLYQIHTGFNGIEQLPNDELVILVSSLTVLQKQGIRFLYTTHHASFMQAGFHNSLDELETRIDWPLLRSGNFKHDPEDPGKKERYQAEALVHEHLPIEYVQGIGCCSDQVQQEIQSAVDAAGVDIKVVTRTGWFFD